MYYEQWLGKRFYKRLSDHDLINAVGFPRTGPMAGRANREMRRRAAKQGFEDAYAWLRSRVNVPRH